METRENKNHLYLNRKKTPIEVFHMSKIWLNHIDQSD